MKNVFASPNLNSLLQFGMACNASQVLCEALRMGLFDLCSGKPLSGRSLARRLKYSEPALKRFLQALCALGLIEEHDGGFRSGALARTYLCRESEEYLGSFFLHQESLREPLANLGHALQSGTMAPPKGKRLAAYARQLKLFLDAMDNLGRHKSRLIARSIPLKKIDTMLDLGGGLGTYSIGFAGKNHALRSVVCDLEDVVKHTSAAIKSAGLADRIQARECQCLYDPLPAGPFDLVFVSNLLHIYNAAESKKVLRKAAGVLKKGGILLVHDYLYGIGDQVGVGLFDMTMLTGTPSGCCHHKDAVVQWVRRIGIGGVRSSAVSGGTSIIYGKKQ